MNYGYAMATAGIVSSMYRQDVAANNLANIETPGFKADLTATIARSAAREEDGLWDLPSNRMLERLGAGVLLAPTLTAFDQGSLEVTTNPLDLAVRGDGFFMVEGAGNGDVRLTRDGRMTLDARGRLVMAAEGRPVLDESGGQIRLDPRQRVVIESTGAVIQGGRQVATIGLVDVPDRTVLKKEGAGLFGFKRPELAGAIRPATGEIVQSAIEKSSADPVRMMMRVTDAAGATAAAGRMATIHDELMNRAINSLGRVTA